MRGIGPRPVDTNRNTWTPEYLNGGDNVVRDLRANVAAEADAVRGYIARRTRSHGAGCTSGRASGRR